MKFSVVIPSYLGKYPNSANNRDKKILRAINSVMNQTFKDFEIIIIADGCKKTIELVKDLDVRHFLLPKGKMWGGEPRNKGIKEAKGEFIVYLDIDDVWGENHLQSLYDSLKDYDWIWFDDSRYHPKTRKWYQNPCDVKVKGRCGTSNVCHKKELDVKWDHDGYAHDYYFIEQLRNYKNHARVEAGEYFVCHIPGAGGYDI